MLKKAPVKFVGRLQILLQKRCASPRQSHHKKGAADLVLRDFRMQIPVALQQEPVAQNAEDIGTQRDVSDHIQARIAPARLKQAAERFAKIAIAEIVEVSATLCRLNQLLQRNASADFAIKHRAKSVKRANDHRRTETIDGGGRLHWARMFQLRCRRRKYNHQGAMVSPPPIYTNGRFGIAAPGIKIVGRAFLLAGLKFKGKRERLPTVAEQPDRNSFC